MLLFLAFLAVNSVLSQFTASQYWIYPLQTLACGISLIFLRRDYEFGHFRKPLVVFAVALVAFVIWIAPQTFLGAAPRRVGFNPEHFGASSALYWSTLLLRFLRLVVVVPIVEEIFWRGFLLRYLVREQFRSVAFGTFTWLSFVGVTIAFALAHTAADWPAAILTGALFNLVAYRSRSLASCVITHALTNLLLGIWIMATRQWGFW
jgi:CAAX prenyl protease-like protein